MPSLCALSVYLAWLCGRRRPGVLSQHGGHAIHQVVSEWYGLVVPQHNGRMDLGRPMALMPTWRIRLLCCNKALPLAHCTLCFLLCWGMRWCCNCAVRLWHRVGKLFRANISRTVQARFANRRACVLPSAPVCVCVGLHHMMRMATCQW